MSIPFTQYFRNGSKELLIDRSIDVENKARQILDVDCYFECEITQDGTVYLECYNDNGQIASESVMNGPEVVTAVDNLVERVFLILGL